MLRSVLCLILVGSALGAETADPLPEAWHGTWTGKLKSTVNGKTTVVATMTLTIGPIADSKNLTWTITNESPVRKPLVRKYELLPGDKAGTYTVDEKNGITLPMILVEGVLQGQYEINGVLFTTRYDLRDDTLRFMLTTGSRMSSGEVGGTKVTGFRTNVAQSAELTRVRKEKPTK